MGVERSVGASPRDEHGRANDRVRIRRRLLKTSTPDTARLPTASLCRRPAGQGPAHISWPLKDVLNLPDSATDQRSRRREPCRNADGVLLHTPCRMVATVRLVVLVQKAHETGSAINLLDVYDLSVAARWALRRHKCSRSARRNRWYAGERYREAATYLRTEADTGTRRIQVSCRRYGSLEAFS